MIGALIGDIIGSRFEWNNKKSKEFVLFTDACRPTDDSVMTLAVAKAILLCKGDFSRLSQTVTACMQELGRRYPEAGYGARFYEWIFTDEPKPYNSWGNGSAMRVSPCGYAASSLEEAVMLAKITAEVTHNHPEGIKGAQAVAAAIYLARTGASAEEIRKFIAGHYYKIAFTLEDIRPYYSFDVSCQGSVPQAFEALFEASDFEDAIRNAISIGGDSDTIGAITASMAEACHGVPPELREQALKFLDERQKHILFEFESQYGIN